MFVWTGRMQFQKTPQGKLREKFKKILLSIRNSFYKNSQRKAFSFKVFYGDVEKTFENTAENFWQKPMSSLFKVRKWYKVQFFSKNDFPHDVPSDTQNAILTDPPKNNETRPDFFVQFPKMTKWKCFFEKKTSHCSYADVECSFHNLPKNFRERAGNDFSRCPTMLSKYVFLPQKHSFLETVTLDTYNSFSTTPPKHFWPCVENDMKWKTCLKFLKNKRFSSKRFYGHGRVLQNLPKAIRQSAEDLSLNIPKLSKNMFSWKNKFSSSGSYGHVKCKFKNPAGNISRQSKKTFAQRLKLFKKRFSKKNIFRRNVPMKTWRARLKILPNFLAEGREFSVQCQEKMKTTVFSTEWLSSWCSFGYAECHFDRPAQRNQEMTGSFLLNIPLWWKNEIIFTFLRK